MFGEEDLFVKGILKACENLQGCGDSIERKNLESQWKTGIHL